MTCLFCDIVNGSLPATLLYEDDQVIVFDDINPQAPFHGLIVPKEHIANIDEAENTHQALLGHMMLTAQKLARRHAISENGYRLIVNVKSHGGQTVNHLHMHVMGGRSMKWPPG